MCLLAQQGIYQDPNPKAVKAPPSAAQGGAKKEKKKPAEEEDGALVVDRAKLRMYEKSKLRWVCVCVWV